ncbi:MAG: hypothetical protein AB7L90_05365 [Hyphomicrobiaceae bacterium]
MAFATVLRGAAFFVVRFTEAARAFVVFGAFATFVDFTARRAVPERFVLAAALTVLRAEVRALVVFAFDVFAIAAISISFVFPEARLTVCPDESANLADIKLRLQG